MEMSGYRFLFLLCASNCVIQWGNINVLACEESQESSVSEENTATDLEGKKDVLEHPEQNNPNDDEYVEGDIKRRIKPKFKNAISEYYWTRCWPNGRVYFTFYNYPRFSTNGKAMIKNAMKYITNATEGCITFHPRTTQRDYVKITNKAGCSSYVGMQYDFGGAEITLKEPGCVIKIGTVVHEILHALGFWHEHSRSDRNEYINIIDENILPGKERQFKTHKTNNQNLKYDYGSVMHYSPLSFSKDANSNLKTIEPKYDIGNAKMGQRDHLSEIDIIKIKKLYGCGIYRQNARFNYGCNKAA